MHSRWLNRIALAPLFLAALAVHCDLPRLSLVFQLGDTLNAVRVMDPMQHTRLARLLDDLPGNDELARALQDGRESLDLIAQTPVLHAVVPPRLIVPALDTHTQLPRHEAGETEPLPLAGLASRLFEIDLPPPLFETPWRPPQLVQPIAAAHARCARAPPLVRG